MPTGWVLHGERWGLWWAGREVASVQPAAAGARVVLTARKIWQNKEVRAASVRQGRLYAERWCAARLLPEIPLRRAVERLTTIEETPPPRRTATERQQARRLAAALRPPAFP